MENKNEYIVVARRNKFKESLDARLVDGFVVGNARKFASVIGDETTLISQAGKEEEDILHLIDLGFTDDFNHNIKVILEERMKSFRTGKANRKYEPFIARRSASSSDVIKFSRKLRKQGLLTKVVELTLE